MNAALDDAVQALLRETAAKVVMPRWRNLQAGEVIEKGVDDVVTVADREAEEMLEEGLLRILPEAQVVGEEAVHADAGVLERLGNLCWIIDPIDGTANYASGKGHFALMVALADGGVPLGSWIFNPLRPRMLHARLGEGAYVDGEQATARGTGETPPVLSLMSNFMSQAQRDVVSQSILPHVRQVEGPRCAAEEYPNTAMGTSDAALYQRTYAWDHAAGSLWVNEAGGMAARIDGHPYRVDDDRSGMLVASSEALWQDLAGKLTAAGYERL